MRSLILTKWLVIVAGTFCLCTAMLAQVTTSGVTQGAGASLGASPAALPEFGTRAEGDIRVAVRGQANRPGIYYLARGACVHDAIQSAQGLQKLFWWGESNLVRVTSDGQKQVSKFSIQRSKAAENERVILQEGDVLNLGYEVY